MTKHDRQRINALKNVLEKAKKKAENASLYLQVNENDLEALWDVSVVSEHIEVSLDKLNARLQEGESKCQTKRADTTGQK